MSEKKRITRIDMYENPNGVMVEKFAEGWTAGSYAVESYKNTTDSLDEMVKWLKDNGWTVLQWPGSGPKHRGARAFLGRLMPVRSRWGINYYRQLFSKPDQKWRTKADPLPLSQIDFALYY